MKKMRSFISLVFVLVLVLFLYPASVYSDYEGVETVEEMVQILRQECLASGASGEYAQAVWMHDWLITHADYDETLSVYGPEGVLLHGTGVCESYSSAYQLLLNSLGIQCQIIASEEMNHAWNFACIDGTWCHIDVTWDDPAGGGLENHNYFGMNDELASRDHTWLTSDLPPAPDLTNYYPLREGELCFSTEEELAAILASEAEKQTTPISVLFVGGDKAFSAPDAIQSWISKNDWKYGLENASFTYSESGYSCSVSFEYSEPWTKPSVILDVPVPAPGFSLNSPEGCFKLSSYSENGVLLVFGRNGCYNTESFLSRLTGYREMLSEKGVEILVSIESAASPMDIMQMENKFPGFHYVYDNPVLLGEYLSAAGYDAPTFSYPAVFIINASGQIIYYSTGYVSDMDELIEEALLTSGSGPLPQPGKNEDNTGVECNVSISSLRSGTLKTVLSDACAMSTDVFFLTDNDVYGSDAAMMQQYEENYTLFSRLGISLVASFQNMSEELEAAFPHVTFVSYQEKVFQEMLQAVGHNMPYYFQCCYYLDSDGIIREYSNGSILSIWSRVSQRLDNTVCEVVMPASMTSVENETFRYTALHSVDLTNSGITSIGEYAFADCSGLTIVKLPATVADIALTAFENSENVLLVCPYRSYAALFAENNNIPYCCP